MNCKRPLKPRPGAVSAVIPCSQRRGSPIDIRIDALCLRARSGRWADCAPASARADALFRRWHGLRRKAVPWSEPPVHGAPYAWQTRCHAPLTRVTVSHASVTSRLERGECSLFTDVASRALHLSVHPNPRPLAKRVPAWERSSGGRGCDPTRANRGAFGKLNKWRCERVKPPSTARKNYDGPRGTGTDAAPRKSGCSCKRYGADTMARLP